MTGGRKKESTKWKIRERERERERKAHGGKLMSRGKKRMASPRGSVNGKTNARSEEEDGKLGATEPTKTDARRIQGRRVVANGDVAKLTPGALARIHWTSGTDASIDVGLKREEEGREADR